MAAGEDQPQAVVVDAAVVVAVVGAARHEHGCLLKFGGAGCRPGGADRAPGGAPWW